MDASKAKASSNAWEFYTLKPLIACEDQKLNVHDCCALLVVCPKHNRFALCNSLRSGHHYRWLPYSYLSPNAKWLDVRTALLAAILGVKQVEPKMENKRSCLSLLRLQQSLIMRFIVRIIYYVELNPAEVDLCLVSPKVSDVYVEWTPVEAAMKEQINHLWGPEVTRFVSIVAKGERIKEIVEERSIQDLFKMFADARDEHEMELFFRSRMKPREVVRIYNDYLEHTFPALEMSVNSFRFYMIKHGIETTEWRIESYWNAFRHLHNAPSLTFRELITGLMAISRDMPHCEYRVKFIFRFYDRTREESLNLDEFRTLVKDVCEDGTPKDKMEEKLSKILYRIKYELVRKEPMSARGARKKSHQIFVAKVGYRTFLQAVKTKILRGTSKLCRMRVLLFDAITKARLNRNIEPMFAMRYSFRRQLSLFQNHKKCPSCVSRNEKLPYHLAHNIAFLSDTRKLLNACRYYIPNLETPSSAQAELIKHSLDIQFDNHSLPNKHINLIRGFNDSGAKGTPRKTNGMFFIIKLETERSQYIREITQICNEVIKLLKDEPHIVDVNSPIYIIGDIHGNLEDLLSLEKALWPSVPFFPGVNYLFLGDYVDRGKWSFEVVIYIFCLKLLAPHKVKLLRGNHEDRSLQQMYSYDIELNDKFGDELGTYLFDLTNSVFDYLPFGAIVDNVIFGAHGGIPYTDVGVPVRETVKNVPKKIQHPTQEVDLPSLFNDLLWADPIEKKALMDEFDFRTDNGRSPDAEEYRAMLELGYLPNMKRQSSHVFSEVAFDRFCAVNGLTNMVRAHEVPEEGFRFNFGQRCITIFSCSHYCGLNNEAATVLACKERLRVVQLSTSKNQCAMDM